MEWNRIEQNGMEQNRIEFGFEPFRARCTQALRLALCASYCILNQRSPVPLAKFQISSASQYGYMFRSLPRSSSDQHLTVKVLSVCTTHYIYIYIYIYIQYLLLFNVGLRIFQAGVETCSHTMMLMIVHVVFGGNKSFDFILRWAGQRSGYSDWLRARRSGDRIPVRVEIFRTCPDRPWGPPSPLYNGYQVFSEGKERPGRDADPSPPSSVVVYSPYGPYGLYRASVPVRG